MSAFRIFQNLSAYLRTSYSPTLPHILPIVYHTLTCISSAIFKKSASGCYRTFRICRNTCKDFSQVFSKKKSMIDSGSFAITWRRLLVRFQEKRKHKPRPDWGAIPFCFRREWFADGRKIFPLNGRGRPLLSGGDSKNQAISGRCRRGGGRPDTLMLWWFCTKKNIIYH